ncbi:hypothetical protein DsansV1_C17g0146211 [Dioscorea sansibarensis]
MLRWPEWCPAISAGDGDNRVAAKPGVRDDASQNRSKADASIDDVEDLSSLNTPHIVLLDQKHCQVIMSITRRCPSSCNTRSFLEHPNAKKKVAKVEQPYHGNHPVHLINPRLINIILQPVSELSDDSNHRSAQVEPQPTAQRYNAGGDASHGGRKLLVI